MNLKYATLGLISGYLGGYILDYLNKNQNQNTNSNANAYNFDTTLEEESTI